MKVRGVQRWFDLSQESDQHIIHQNIQTLLQQHMGEIETHQTSSNIQQLLKYI